MRTNEQTNDTSVLLGNDMGDKHVGGIGHVDREVEVPSRRLGDDRELVFHDETLVRAVNLGRWQL